MCMRWTFCYFSCFLLCKRRIYTFTKLLGVVFNDVEIEPQLQPLEGETFDNKSTSTEDEARVDIKANGLFDSSICRTYFDVGIFNPFANSCPKQIQEAGVYAFDLIAWV